MYKDEKSDLCTGLHFFVLSNLEFFVSLRVADLQLDVGSLCLL